ncbi:hypothetical protein ACTHSM_06080 [Neisseria sp. P0009.S001]|uniref:hypothetical protein n=1 Tax=unclassified Neisseria TaxID=2623750 RepID=UPI003F7E9642
MKNKILLLNIRNKEIDNLFNELRSNYHNSIPSFPHITIRGPRYKFNDSTIEKVEKVIQTISIEVVGLDIMEYKNLYFCVFKVNSPALKDIWDKPDFPIREFGFNPHITLYKGNKNIAKKIKNKIESEKRYKHLIFNSKDIEIKKSIIGQYELAI